MQRRRITFFLTYVSNTHTHKHAHTSLYSCAPRQTAGGGGGRAERMKIMEQLKRLQAGENVEDLGLSDDDEEEAKASRRRGKRVEEEEEEEEDDVSGRELRPVLREGQSVGEIKKKDLALGALFSVRVRYQALQRFALLALLVIVCSVVKLTADCRLNKSNRIFALVVSKTVLHDYHRGILSHVLILCQQLVSQ